MSCRTLNVLRALVFGSTLIAGPALAFISSSCPAPCVKPPKSALFMRESNLTDSNGFSAGLSGMLSRGSARTVVPVDTRFLISDRGTIPALDLYVLLNGKYEDASFGGISNACATTHPYCSVTGTFWFDVDALEAANPGMFVGQPLSIWVAGGPLTGNSPSVTYQLTFSAQVVKKK